jgi:hypothetical protein
MNALPFDNLPDKPRDFDTRNRLKSHLKQRLEPLFAADGALKDR